MKNSNIFYCFSWTKLAKKNKVACACHCHFGWSAGGLIIISIITWDFNQVNCICVSLCVCLPWLFNHNKKRKTEKKFSVETNHNLLWWWYNKVINESPYFLSCPISFIWNKRKKKKQIHHFFVCLMIRFGSFGFPAFFWLFSLACFFFWENDVREKPRNFSSEKKGFLWMSLSICYDDKFFVFFDIENFYLRFFFILPLYVIWLMIFFMWKLTNWN